MLKRIFFIQAYLFVAMYCYSQDSALLKKNLEAKTINQEAQARYYDRQNVANKTKFIDFLPVIGTLLGAGLGFLTLLFQLKQTRKLDDDKWNKAQIAEGQRLDRINKEDNLRNTRLAGADLMGKTAIATHNLTWILWIARNDFNGFTYDLIEEHDKKMNKIYPKIVHAQVVLAAHDKALFYMTEDLIKQMYHYDGELGRLAVELKKGNRQKIKDMGGMWQEVYDFSLALPSKFAAVLESIATQKNQLPVGTIVQTTFKE